jgi:hypothetical protein
MLHCAVASQLRVHGDSLQDGSERSLDSPENKCSIGFQPVFFRTSERRFPSSHRSSGMWTKLQKKSLPKSRALF